MYHSCVWSETWPLTKMNLQRLQRNGKAMTRQIYSIKIKDVAIVRSSKLLAKLELEDLENHFERWLYWLGMWSILVVQRELMAGGGGREAQANMEETDKEGLL